MYRGCVEQLFLSSKQQQTYQEVEVVNNHGFGVEEGLSWLAKLAGGGEEWRKHTCWMGQNRERQRKDSHLCDCTKEITQFISGPALPFIVWYSVRLKD